ncbi:MAG: LPS-assembly protein LptD, partial [Candidatus Cloacimonetes bacterium]|nr:LPS-assembly protein LptD [Candidatus Cloacimonadota bacterium]
MKKSILREKIALILLAIVLTWAVLAWTQNSSENIISSGNDSLMIDSLDVVLSDTIMVEIDSVFYSADSVFYNVENEEIELVGNASITYHSSHITADTILIDLGNDQAFAKGKSFMQDGTQNMLGKDICYDLDSQWGLVYQGASKFDKGYYYGKEIRKVDKTTYDVDNGIFTTCDGLHPHFYIYSEKLRVYRNDKIVGKPVVFYVNHFPVFALPFGTFTIKR